MSPITHGPNPPRGRPDKASVLGIGAMTRAEVSSRVPGLADQRYNARVEWRQQPIRMKGNSVEWRIPRRSGP